MAMHIDTKGMSAEVEIDEGRPGKCLEEVIGGNGYIVAVCPNSMAMKSGYSFGCFRGTGKILPENRRATIWLGRSPVKGDVVFLKESELYGLPAEQKLDRIEAQLTCNRTK